MNARRAGWRLVALWLVGTVLALALLPPAVLGLALPLATIGVLVALLLEPQTKTGTGTARWRRALRSLRPTEAQLEGLARSLAYTNPTYLPVEPVAPSQRTVLTDEQLCAAWRDSGTAVRRPATRRAWLRAVEQRGRYLDELEARQPGLLRAWLASDAGQQDDLVPLADPSRIQPSAIDWDELTGGQATDR